MGLLGAGLAGGKGHRRMAGPTANRGGRANQGQGRLRGGTTCSWRNQLGPRLGWLAAAVCVIVTGCSCRSGHPSHLVILVAWLL